jgi:hypothetical protein
VCVSLGTRATCIIAIYTYMGPWAHGAHGPIYSIYGIYIYIYIYMVYTWFIYGIYKLYINYIYIYILYIYYIWCIRAPLGPSVRITIMGWVCDGYILLLLLSYGPNRALELIVHTSSLQGPCRPHLG